MKLIGNALKIIAFLCLISVSTTVCAEDNNAAVRYLMAVGHLPGINREVDHDLSNLETVSGIDGLSTETVDIATRLYNNRIFQLVVLAAKLPECNFAPDNKHTPEDFSPPYRSLIRLARFCVVQARIYEKHGEKDKAFELMSALIGMGSHLSRNDLLLGAILGKVIAKYGVRSLSDFFNRHPEKAYREKLAAYISRLPKPVIDFTATMKNERQMLINANEYIQKNAEAIKNRTISAHANVDGEVTTFPFPEELYQLVNTAALQTMFIDALNVFDRFIAISPLDPEFASKTALIAREVGKTADQKNYWLKYGDPGFSESGYAKVGLEIADLEKEIENLLKD